jgi:hypothetical protein
LSLSFFRQFCSFCFTCLVVMFKLFLSFYFIVKDSIGLCMLCIEFAIVTSHTSIWYILDTAWIILLFICMIRIKYFNTNNELVRTQLVCSIGSLTENNHR